MDATEQPSEKGIKAAFDPGSQNSVRISNMRETLQHSQQGQEEINWKIIDTGGDGLPVTPRKFNSEIYQKRGDKITEQTVNMQ